MDGIPTFAHRSPVALCRGVGERLRKWRLQRGWTQEEVAERAGVGLSTVKALEKGGRGTFPRLVRVAVALDLEGDIRALFAPPTRASSLEEVKRRDRQRAPRRQRAAAPPKKNPSRNQGTKEADGTAG